MQPKFTLKTWVKCLRTVPVLFILLGLGAGKTNAQCTWTTSTVYPIPIQDQQTAGVGANIYSFGGYSNAVATTNSYRFDGTTWTAIAALPQALIAGGAVSDGTNVYIIGGYAAGAPQNVLYRYNVASNTYTTLASSPSATVSHAVAIVAGKIYKIAGATHGAGTATNVVNIYDIASNTWTTGATYPAATTWARAYAEGNFIYVAGGLVAGTPTAKAYRYSISGNTWDDAAMTDLPQTRWGAASDYYNGGFIMAGGVVNGNAIANISNTVVSYDVAANNWNNLPNMTGERYRANAAVLTTGLHAVGGVSQTSTAFNGTNINQRLNCITLLPCTGTPAAGNTVSTANPVCPTVSYTVSTQTPPASGLTFQWQNSPDGTTWTDIPGAVGSSYTTTMTGSVYYRARVSCGANTTFSAPLQVLQNTPSNCYCIPPATDCTDDDVITRVIFSSLNNASTCSAGPPAGYGNFTALPAPNAFSGAPNPITVEAPATFSEQVAVWIDYDRDGQLETTEYTNIGNKPAGQTSITGNINIPASVTAGPTRMRVRIRFATALGAGDACLGYTFGETEDYTVNITPCIPVTITGAPSSTSIVCGGNATFTVSTAGSLPAYSWQYRTSAAGIWQTVTGSAPMAGITGVNGATLTLSNVPASLSGYQFRALVSGACSAVDFSAPPATLTVTPIIPVVTPASATICLGAIQQLTLTNTLGNADLISEGFDNVVPLPAGWAQQNLSTPVGTQAGWFQGNPAVFPSQSGVPAAYIAANFNNVAGNNTISKWLFTPAVAMKNGDVLKFWTRTVAAPAFPDRLEVRQSSAGASVNVGATNTSVGDFTNLLLTVNPTLTTAGYPNAWTEYTVTISGLAAPTTGRIAFRYFVTSGGPSGANSDYIGIDNVKYTSTGGAAQGIWTGPAGTIFTNSGATTPYVAGTPLTTVWVQPTAGGVNNYQVSFTTLTPCTSATTTVPVTVVTPISAVVNPSNTTVCAGTNATFTASASGGPLTYQWQQSIDAGLTWTNIAGATSGTLTLNGVTTSMTGYRYRAVISAAPCASSTTASATLTVNALPNVSISAPDLSLAPGQQTTITATSSPAAAVNGWTWTLNGSSIAGTTNTQVVNVDGMGVYRARVVDVNGCIAFSNELTIGAEASDRLWIYPNPNSGVFQVRLYYGGPVTERRVVRIFKSNGQLVMEKEFTLDNVVSPYLRMDFDLNHLASGTYVVKVDNTVTGKITSGLVVIQHE